MNESADSGDAGHDPQPAPASPVRGPELRERLIESGLALIEQSGYAGLSLREVARASGVSHMAPYGTFSSKNDLLSAVAAAGYKAFRLHLAAAAGRGGDSPRRQLVQVAQAYVDFALDHPQLLRLMFGGVIPVDQQSDELRAAHGQAFNDSMRIIAAGVARGEFRHADPAVAAFAGWSVVHGFTQLVLGNELQEKFGPSQQSLQQVTQQVIDTFLQGLDARSAG